MRRFELIAPCHFGMESVLKREITDLGYDITDVADGRVTFFGDEEALCRANIFLRTAQRHLRNCFRERKVCPGKITFLRTVSSG